MGETPEESGPDEAANETRLQRLLSWATDRPLRQVLLGVGFIALLLTAPFGGLNAAPKVDPMKALKVNEPFTSGPLTVKVTRAVADTDPSTAFGPPDGGAYIMVFALVSSTDPTTVDPDVMTQVLRVSSMKNLIKVPVEGKQSDPIAQNYDQFVAVPGDKAGPKIYSAADATPLPSIGPGITYEAVYIFQTRDVDIPSSITLTAYDFTWRKSAFQQREQWLDPTPSGTMTLPIELKHSAAHEKKQSS